ncbi:MAG: Alkaline phosphatase PafA [Elusimicrobia bacterium]|nr:Alkaline phosphatase PafA [Elusimicrobiota bacterium]
MIVVVDQLRADQLEEKPNLIYKKGFKRLLGQSLYYSHAQLEHIPTETAPGHAAIITGKPPGETGIISNVWYDRETRKTITSIESPHGGLGPDQLMTKTLGDVLKETNPLSQVVSISFKDRSAILLGGHKADMVLWFDEKLRKVTSSKAYGSTPDWVNEFNTHYPIKKELFPSPEIDVATFRLVKKVLETSSLGQDGACDLLTLSFSGTDLIGHTYGPDSKQIKDQLGALDGILDELLNLLHQKTNGDFVLALTSDHGVLPVPESPEGKKMGAQRVRRSDLEKQLEAACQALYPEPQSSWIVGCLFPHLYLNKPLVIKRGLDWGRFLLQIQSELKKNKMVASVYLNNPLIEQDKFSRIYQRSYFAGRSGDLMVRFKPGVLVTPYKSGTSHGSPYDYDATVPLLFYGQSFNPERINTPVSIELLAPTLAKVMGLDFN